MVSASSAGNSGSITPHSPGPKNRTSSSPFRLFQPYNLVATLLIAFSLSVPVLGLSGISMAEGGLYLVLFPGLLCMGFFMLAAQRALSKPAGIDNHGIYHSGVTGRGLAGILLGVVITGLYVVIYFGSRIDLAEGFTLHQFFQERLYSHFNPISEWMRNKPADNWFFYSLMYTLAVFVFGIRMILKHRHSAYQVIRTLSVMAVQTGFGFLIPQLLAAFNKPEFYFSYFWPLKPEYLYPSAWGGWASDALGRFFTGQAELFTYFLAFGAFMTFVATPVLTYFFGKRWYCSWVCGCGGLANTAGDPFRQLSDKSLKAWKIERWLIHSVLVAIVIVTGALWANSLSNGKLLPGWGVALRDAYGFYIGLIFSGVVGVGFYPLLGTRVWCRFGCPMAAILGILQKWFSRFRITTNGGQCISCGNCSTYCEMGIDVRWYAQRGQNIVRASCVGCGLCSAVCPRGVLNLENGIVTARVQEPVI